MNVDISRIHERNKGKLITTLINTLNPYKQIILAYLYGSAIKGDFHSKSDIDIGIYVDETVLKDRWFPINLQNDLEKNLKDTVYKNHEIDVRIINFLGVKFQYSVIFENPRLIVRDEEFRVNFEKRVMINWYDIKPTYDFFYKQRDELIKSGY